MKLFTCVNDRSIAASPPNDALVSPLKFLFRPPNFMTNISMKILFEITANDAEGTLSHKMADIHLLGTIVQFFSDLLDQHCTLVVKCVNEAVKNLKMEGRSE